MKRNRAARVRFWGVLSDPARRTRGNKPQTTPLEAAGCRHLDFCGQKKEIVLFFCWSGAVRKKILSKEVPDCGFIGRLNPVSPRRSRCGVERKEQFGDVCRRSSWQRRTAALFQPFDEDGRLVTSTFLGSSSPRKLETSARSFSANEISIFGPNNWIKFNDTAAILLCDAEQSRRDGAQIPTAARLVVNHWKLLLDQNYLRRSREAVIRVISRLKMVTLKNKLASPVLPSWWWCWLATERQLVLSPLRDEFLTNRNI